MVAMSGTWRCWKRFLSHKTAFKGAEVSTPDTVRRLENLALRRVHNLQEVHEEAKRFSDASADMSSLHLIRGINAFANIGFCNKDVLVSLAERMEELCETGSPKRINHMVTLLKRLNVTHPLAVKPLVDAVKRNLHNYVEELPDMIRNMSHLSPDDRDLVELMRTQVLLHFDNIGKVSIRCAEALSRFRQRGCSLMNRVSDTFMPTMKELPLKQQLYLLAALTRSELPAECQKVKQEILESLPSVSLPEDCISMILTLQNAIGVVSPRILDIVVQNVELRLGNPDYITSSLPYHLYVLGLLANGDRSAIWALVDRVLEKGVERLSGVAASQLLYLISILMRESAGTSSVEPELLRNLCSHVEAFHCRLSIQKQEELYLALLFLKGRLDLPPGLTHFVSTKIPSSIPVTCARAHDQQIGTVGGINYMYNDTKQGVRDIFVCITETAVLNVVEDTSSVILRPEVQHGFHTLESQLQEHVFDYKKGCVSYRKGIALDDKMCF